MKTCALLALANLFWAGNWVVGRALREDFTPVGINFWRWVLAAAVLAPFALARLRGQWHLVRRHAGLLVMLAATGGALFQSMVYIGLRETTAVNAVLISASGPLVVMLCAWLIDRHAMRRAQVTGMMLSCAGVIVILARGDPSALLQLGIHTGDAWILAAMPVFGIYSVLLKRVPKELGGSALLFAIAALSALMLAVQFLDETHNAATSVQPGAGALLGIAYVAVFASVLAFACWNRGVAAVGAADAGLSLPLMPLFGTVLAIAFLGETIRAFHAGGGVAILAGIAIATRTARGATAMREPAAAPATRASPQA